MRGKKYCRASWLQDSSIARDALALLIFSAVVGGALIYEGILILMNETSFPLKNLLLNMLLLLIGQSLLLFGLKLKENPIVTTYGLSIPLNMAEPELRETSWLRVFISWKDITKIVIDSKIVDRWEAKFIPKKGPEIHMTSQMGYGKECFFNLIELANRFEKVDIEVSISKTALKLAEEYRKEGK